MIEWIATAFSICGNVFNIKKSVWGFVLWIVGNSIWMWIGYTKHMWGMLTLFTIYNAMSFWGIYEWTRPIKIGKTKAKATRRK